MKGDFILSIITPFYKGNIYLPQLFSVINKNCETLKQRYPQATVELVIVNDSPEIQVNVPDICCLFQYRIIEHEKNEGIHQARVTGLKNCLGEYILFLDQDDVLLDNAILNQISVFDESGNDIVVCNAYMEKEDGSYSLLYKSNTDFKLINNIQYYLKSHNMIKSPGQCIIKKSSIPIEWQTNLIKKNGSDDLFLWILMFEKGIQFAINKAPVYIHKYTGKNLSEDIKKMNMSTLEIVDVLKEIEYIPKNHIDVLKRTLLFSSDFYGNERLKRITAILNNFSLFLYLVVTKLKRMIV